MILGGFPDEIRRHAMILALLIKNAIYVIFDNLFLKIRN